MELDAQTAPTHTRRIVLIILASIGILALAGAAYLFLERPWEPKKLDLGITSITSYVCPDDSHYVVIKKENEVSISGQSFPRIDDVRYGNGGDVEFMIEGTDLVVRNTETDENTRCIEGLPEGGMPPLVL